MIGRLRPYADMRASGSPWLGDVPAHWDVRRIKTLLREVDNRTKTGEERLLSLRMRQGLVDHIDAGGKLIPPESLVNFRIVEPGQVVMNRMRAAAGLFAVASVRGLVSPDYAVFEPKPEAFNPYLLQAFRLPSLSAVFRAESKGLGTGESGFLRLYTDRFGPIPVPYPPLDEQRLIVRFLDWYGGQTASLIRAKKKIIALLNEQKQAIIHRAVTRGLDRSVSLKDTGVPWIGDIPTHWELLPLGRVLAERVEKNDPVKTTNVLALSLHDGVTLYADKRAGGNKAKDDISAYKLAYPGDIVVNSMNVVVGSVGLSRYFGAVSPVYYMLRPRSSLDVVEFFAALFSDKVFQSSLFGLGNGIMFIQSRATGKLNTIRLRIPIGKLNRVEIPYPPVKEQAAIVDGITAETAQINTYLESSEREIALIQEFRARLIADVVTGKLDVRALAASLPEIAELEAIDDLVEGEDLDEAIDDAENEEVAA
jgi:type I restriction enzyme, S subunit